MMTLPISTQLAETLMRIAVDENQPLEDVLRSMVEVYQMYGLSVEVEKRLRQLPGVIAPVRDEFPPMTDAERIDLAKRVGENGDLSSWVIEGRN